MRNRDLAWGWILGVGVLSMLIGRAAGQDTSTPEERMQWVEVTHKLESAPLDDSVNKQGEAAFKRLSDVHDVHVLLCPALAGGPPFHATQTKAVEFPGCRTLRAFVSREGCGFTRSVTVASSFGTIPGQGSRQ